MANEKPKALSTDQQAKPELDLSVMKQETANADKLESIKQSTPPEQIQPVFKTLHHGAKIPMIQTEDSAGADIHSLSRIRIEAGRSAVIHTGIAIDHKLPKGICIIMEMRSGLRFSKNLTQLGLGIIDGDYLGEIKGLIHNPNPNDVFIDEGERFAQLIFIEHKTAAFCESKTAERNQNGFGSTGTN